MHFLQTIFNHDDLILSINNANACFTMSMIKLAPWFIFLCNLYFTDVGFAQNNIIHKNNKENNATSTLPPALNVLKNGMKLLIKEKKESPIVSIEAWVTTGTASESSEEKGFSELIERMIGFETNTYQPQEIFKNLNQIGSYLEAKTSIDASVFHLDIHQAALENGLKMLQSALFLSQWNHVAIQQEWGRIQENQKKRAQQPIPRAISLLHQQVYESHPYGHAFVFDSKSKNLDLDRLQHFYNTHYQPNRTILIVSSPNNTQETIQLVERIFENTKNTTEPQSIDENKNITLANKKSHFVIQEHPYHDAFVSCAWPVPMLKSQESALVALLAVALAGGQNSKLMHALKIEQPLVQATYSIPYIHSQGGMLMVGFSAKKENARPAYQKMIQEIFKLKRDTLSEDELLRSKKQLFSNQAWDEDESASWVQKMGYFFMATGALDAQERYLQNMLKTNAEALREVAKQYLTLERMSCVFLLPQKSMDAFKSDELWQVSKKIEQQNKAPIPYVLQTDTQGRVRIQFNSGATVLIEPEQESARVAVNASYFGGLYQESLDNNGIHALLAQLLLNKTKDMNEEEVKQKQEKLGVYMRAMVLKNALSFEARMVKDDFAQALEFWLKLILEPGFSDTLFEQEKTNLLAHIRERDDNPRVIGFEYLKQALFDSPDTKLKEWGSVEAVSKLKAAQVLQFYKDTYTLDKLVLSIVGDVDYKQIVNMLDRLLKKSSTHSSNTQDRTSPLVFQDSVLKEVKIIDKKISDSKSYVLFGIKTVALSHPDQLTLEVAAKIIEEKLQESFKKSQNAVRVMVSSDIYRGYMAILVPFNSEQSKVMKNIFENELKNILKQPITEQVFTHALLSKATTYGLARESLRLQANELSLFELYQMTKTDKDKALLNLKIADVQRVIKNYVDLNRCVYVLMTP